MLSVPLLLAPLFGATLIGVIAALVRLFGLTEARVFSRLIFQVAMPVAVFEFMRGTSPPNAETAGLVAGYALGWTISSTLAFIVARRWIGVSMQAAGGAVFTATCGNAVFLGLPVALQIPGWGPAFLLLMIFEGFFVFALATMLFTWPKEAGAAPRPLHVSLGTASLSAIRNPIIIAVLLGATMGWLNIPLPELISAPFRFFGQVAAPMGMFVLGLYIVLLLREQTSVPISVLTGLLPIKLVVFPAISTGTTYLLTKDPTLTSVAAFFTLLPPAVGSVIIAANFQHFEREAAAAVSIGSLIGFLSVIGFLALTVG